MNAMVQTSAIDAESSKFTDEYWAAASESALRATDEAEYVLVPPEFLHLHPCFVPLEFSWGLPSAERLAWCCPKDDVDKLAPWLHSYAADPATCYWSNEVFAIGSNFAWAKSGGKVSRLHWQAWLERVERYRSGVPARPLKATAAPQHDSEASIFPNRKRVLLVGASGMGNLGDDLLAEALSSILVTEQAEVSLSGPDIDPLHVAAYDAVIVGGGGLIYASRQGANETQNLANYLKFGAIANHFGLPAALIGVGDQDHHDAIEQSGVTRSFARETIRGFKLVTTRDHDSTNLLRRLGAKAIATGCDPVFSFAARARAAVRPTVSQPGRTALIGELYDYCAFAEGLSDGQGPLATQVRDGDFDLLIMSDDDVPHCQRLKKALQRAGASATAVVDLRGKTLEALVFLFASYRGVITTRFHGLVLAALAGVPVVALDHLRGKKARLLRDMNAQSALITNDCEKAAFERLDGALNGNFVRLGTSAVNNMAAFAEVHRLSIQQLLSRPMQSSAAPASSCSSVRPRRATGAIASLQKDGAGPVPLCWAAGSDHTQGFGNLGDSLSAVMVAALAGRPIKHTNFDEDRTKLVAVGSIGHAISRGTAVIWGCGVSIRGGVLAENVFRTQYDIRAIRGAISAQHFRDFGISVPDVYGDPVWLLPSILNEPVEKKYELGVIPHIQDVAQPHPDAPPKGDSLRYIVEGAARDQVAIINTWHEPTWEGLLAKIRLIRSCKRIVSQSFHGVVIAEAYGIPVLNFRHLPKAESGLVKISLTEPCATDPRIWEFFRGGERPYFHMYNQRRDEHSDWSTIIRTIDEVWQPFEFDATPLVQAFPLPLAYDPLNSVIPNTHLLQALSF